MMYILNIISAIKKMAIKKLKGFIYVNYYNPIRFHKENIYGSMKRQKRRFTFTIICNQIN